MKKHSLKQPIVLLVIFAFLHAHILHAVPMLGKDRAVSVRAAYLGVRYGEMSPVFKKRMDERMQGLFDGLRNVVVMQPTAVTAAVGEEMVQAFLDAPGKESAREIAARLDADYLFWGKMSQQQQENDRILIVGELNRYDRQSDMLHRFDLVKYYDVIGVEFTAFQQEYVQSVQPQIVQKKILWPWLVVGFAALTFLAIKAVGASFGSEGENGGGDPTIRF